MEITVETEVTAHAGEVWRAYTTPDDICQWNAASDDWHTTAATVDLREGGTFSSRMEAKDGSFGFDFTGAYTRIVPNELIEYDMGGRSARVEFIVRPANAYAAAPERIIVRVTFDAEQGHSIEQQRAGWQAILDNFARHVATKQASA
ncbi:MAG: SRPBCC domain-containing protein [Hyphomicrobium aestuarii]|nr:SRPBCC domain-containing protein [Hyphomicrobium aestuarii]